MSDTILNIENITKSFPRVIANKKVTFDIKKNAVHAILGCLLYTSPSPRDLSTSRMPSSA